jgi:para-nitrobenzyl esterase
VSAYWVNFAATGDPNGKKRPRWDAYQTKEDRAMGFAEAPAMIRLPNKAALDFFDASMQRSRATRSQN